MQLSATKFAQGKGPVSSNRPAYCSSTVDSFVFLLSHATSYLACAACVPHARSHHSSLGAHAQNSTCRRAHAWNHKLDRGEACGCRSSGPMRSCAPCSHSRSTHGEHPLDPPIDGPSAAHHSSFCSHYCAMGDALCVGGLCSLGGSIRSAAFSSLVIDKQSVPATPPRSRWHYALLANVQLTCCDARSTRTAHDLH